MATSPSIDRQTFLQHLRRSGLLDPAQLSDIARRFPEPRTARSIARALWQEGVLTRFQVERLLVGRWNGFFLDQYCILGQIGRGGMGRVYRAEHRTMKRIVALKVLAPELLKTERAVELFLHEVRAVARLVHPHIVAAFDANSVGDYYYLVLEFVDGPNLDQLVRKQGPLSVGLACDYIRQAAMGLAAAHAVGMIHRDIKPANILVQWHGLNGDSSPGLVKVSDFGLARLGEPTCEYQKFNGAPGTILTKENTVMGTPDYLSPEQSRSLHKTDIRSDLYSLGCTFYFLLTGSVPFPGGNSLDKMIRHSTETPASLQQFRSDVPQGVEAIVKKLMAKRPQDRFQTPNELVEALQPFAVSGPTPWAQPKSPSGVYTDLLATPMSEGGSDEISGVRERVLGGSGVEDDLAALDNTKDFDFSPTPTPTPRPMKRINSPTQRLRKEKRHTHHRLRVALLTAIGLAAGLAAAAGVMVKMMR